MTDAALDTAGQIRPSPRYDYDLFLSYHSAEREPVEVLRQLLVSRGLTTFLDQVDLVVGLPWPQAPENALLSARAVAVVIGPTPLGLWQKREIGFALDRQVRAEEEGRAYPVIPVLLQGADPSPGFLFMNTWVDFRNGFSDDAAPDAMIAATQGVPSPAADRQADMVCPYRGLQVFTEEHAGFFFGRETFAEALHTEITRRTLAAVVGPSGSKSSVVQAGLIPLLRRHRPPAATWDAVLFTPGEQPLQRLASCLVPLLEPTMSEVDRMVEAHKLDNGLASGDLRLSDVLERVLAKSGGTDRLLVVADQFEELFTLTPEPSRLRFAEVLMEGLSGTRVCLALTLRADFYGHAIALSRDLSDHLASGVDNLGPMQRAELERAIVEPARRAGLRSETGLVETILDDVA